MRNYGQNIQKVWVPYNWCLSEKYLFVIFSQQIQMKATNYFISNVVVRRPYLKEEWIEFVLKNPLQTEQQENGRIRFWGYITERNKYLRVITEADGETVHNAFFDRSFKPKTK